MAASADVYVNLRANAESLQKGLNSAKASIKSAQKEFKTAGKQITNSLNKMSGGMGSLLKSSSSAFKGVISGVKGMDKAFAATGIGAIITAIMLAITGLTAAFKRSGAAGDELAKVMGFMKGILDYLMKQLVKVGEWLIKAFKDPKAAVIELWQAIKTNLVTRFEGVIKLFQSGWEVIKNGAMGAALAVKGVFSADAREEAKAYFKAAADGARDLGEALVMISTGKTTAEIKAIAAEMSAAGKAGAALAERQSKLDTLRIKNIVELQQMETALSKIKEQMAEKDIRTEDGRLARLALYNKALTQQDAISARRIAYAKEEWQLAEAKAAAEGKTDTATLTRLAELRAAYEAEITAATDKRVGLIRQETNLTAQVDAERAKAAQEYANQVLKDQKSLQNVYNETALLLEKDNVKVAFMKMEMDKQAALAAIEGTTNEAEQRLAIMELYYQKERALAQQFFEDNKKLAAEQAAEVDKQLELQALKALEAHEEKIRQINEYGGAAIGMFDAISTAQTAAMNKELTAAGDNEEKKEAIRKRYARKEKATNIAKAMMGTAMAVINALQTQPFPLGIALAAVASAMGLAQVAAIKSQPLAEGGLAYGKTLATVGEYTGARYNPEVIAPLDKLKTMLGKESLQQQVRFIIEQDKLVGILEQANKKQLYF